MTALEPSGTLDGLIANNVASARVALLKYIIQMPNSMVDDAIANIDDIKTKIEVIQEEQHG